MPSGKIPKVRIRFGGPVPIRKRTRRSPYEGTMAEFSKQPGVPGQIITTGNVNNLAATLRRRWKSTHEISVINGELWVTARPISKAAKKKAVTEVITKAWPIPKEKRGVK